METRSLPVRALYTINISPQYMLARCDETMDVEIIRPAPRAGDPDDVDAVAFGRIPLRPCLEAICDASPELLLDPNRDFSVYVRDPLESYSQGHPPDSLGVALGLGLLSRGLRDSGSKKVVGTLMNDSSGEDALQVLLTVKECAVKPGQPKWANERRSLLSTTPLPMRASSSTSKSTSTTSRSKSSDHKQAKSASSTSRSTSGTSSAKRSSSSQVSSSVTSAQTAATSHSTNAASQPPAESNPSALHTLLCALAATPGKNSGLLGAISSIDASATTGSAESTSQPNSALVDALRVLLSAPQAPVAPPGTVSPADLTRNPTSSSAATQSQSVPGHASGAQTQTPATLRFLTAPGPLALPQAFTSYFSSRLAAAYVNVKQQPPEDDEIVFLDKENVNPSAFKKKERDGKGKEVCKLPSAASTTVPGPGSGVLPTPAPTPATGATELPPTQRARTSKEQPAAEGQDDHHRSRTTSSSISIDAHYRDHTIYHPVIPIPKLRELEHSSSPSSSSSQGAAGLGGRGMKRKRTLSEIMEEKERERKRTLTSSAETADAENAVGSPGSSSPGHSPRDKVDGDDWGAEEAAEMADDPDADNEEPTSQLTPRAVCTGGGVAKPEASAPTPTESDFPTPTTSELGLDAGESAATSEEQPPCEAGTAYADPSIVHSQSSEGTEDDSTTLGQGSTDAFSGLSSDFADWMGGLSEPNYNPAEWFGTDSDSLASSELEALLSDLPAGGVGEPAVNGCLDDAEVAAFWESLKPLMSVDSGVNEGEAGQAGAVGVSAEKLAENIQSLLGGCVL
ncbi:hypothetical protein EVJ58_g6509 [Rhodofomes roseus]|uniref:Ams2/SPT21 N-terminal domain-containing protein n=1 Tax=Rhodofomes roseus TaxID=34475 RepID=A0A4Y9Y8Q8_9APHY|nr:hypothetical protein EVJ58_g6509 [Rhodofomes roseus]